MTRFQRWFNMAIAAFLSVIIFSGLGHQASFAHWDDLSTTEILIADSTVSMTLSVPERQLVKLQGQRAEAESVQSTSNEALIRKHVTFKTNDAIAPNWSITPLSATNLSNSGQHQTFQIQIDWPQRISNFTLDYRLFPQDEPASKLIATITPIAVEGGASEESGSNVAPRNLQQHIFTPKRP